MYLTITILRIIEYRAIIILPLLGSIASGFFGRKIGVSGAQIITCTAVVTTTILAILIFFEVGLSSCFILLGSALLYVDSVTTTIFHILIPLNFYFSFIPFHFWFILVFLYYQKHRITFKKLIVLTVIVFIIPLILHVINLSLPYLLDNFPFILFEFNQLISRIWMFFVSRVYQILFKILSKKGFIDILTSICIIYVMRVVLLGSLSILDIVSNIFITNCFFSLTIDFYSITLIKVVIPYVEKLVIPHVEKVFTSVIKPIFNSYFSPIHCDSPKEVAKLFSELPFSNVNKKVMIEECKTSTNYKSKQDLIAEFKAFRLKISSYTPSSIASMQSGHVTNIEQSEYSREQFFNDKKRALYNTQEEGHNKRAKIDLGNTESTTVTKEDFDGEDWDLHSIYDKINNLMEDPNYKVGWKIHKLFEDKNLQSHFFNYIKVYELTLCKGADDTSLVHLRKNLEEQIKTDYHPYSIKKEDFTKDGLNFLSVHKKLTEVTKEEDFNSRWPLAKLKFEPWNLKQRFNATIEALNLNTCRKASDMTVSGLRNRIWEEYALINHEPNAITREDFTENGLNLESIYNKIKQSVEDGQYKTKDRITVLFPPESQIKLDFYTKLRTLNLIDDSRQVNKIKISTLINLLEKVVDVPCTKDNSITREDLRDGNLYRIYEKIKNLTEDPNFNKRSTITRLEFEPASLRKEFYVSIKNINFTKSKYVGQALIITLKNGLENYLKDNES